MSIQSASGQAVSAVPCMVIRPNGPLSGTVAVNGAKNAVLVSIASLLLVHGTSRLTNVPASNDVRTIIALLQSLGVVIVFDERQGVLTVDTTAMCSVEVDAALIGKMRASVLVLGPLLARFGAAKIALPGGCKIGTRPIDYHLKNFARMGVCLNTEGAFVTATASQLHGANIVLDYPSVGATENIMMAATLARGTTTIINAALEPEVLALIDMLRTMGAQIEVAAPATITVHGVTELQPANFAIIPDRLEAGALLLAGAITGGRVMVSNANVREMDVFLLKLSDMGHDITIGQNGTGITLIATLSPKATSFKTGPYPSFPTDLQSPTMAALTLCDGVSVIEETVFENRMLHVPYLQAMGADITADNRHAVVRGVRQLKGAAVVATDIRASCALVLAGLVAEGTTMVTGLEHWYRGYDKLENKLVSLGANISIETIQPTVQTQQQINL